MYYEHFGLQRAPFGITPDTQLFYAGGKRGDVLDALVYAITHGEGIVKVVGEVGSGKTMLCRMLQTRLPKTVDVVYLSNPRIDPGDVIFAIAGELHLPLPETASRIQVQHAVQELLLARHAENRRVVVFVEEAQGMPLDTLEEIRLLTNLETEREKLLQIVLFGQPELDVHLGDPRIRQLRERITHSFNLGPLAANVIAEYVQHRLRAAGHISGDLFEHSALRLLVRVSQGLMRRVNVMADKALLAAFADGQTRVAYRHMTAALRDSEYRKPVNTSYLWISAAAVMAIIAIIVWSVLRAAEPVAPNAVLAAASPENNIVSRVTAANPKAELAANTLGNEAIGQFVTSRVDHTRAWIRQADGNHFSIQVLRVTADAVKDLERFLRGQENLDFLDRLFIYQARHNGQTVYGVLYSEFATYADAQAALEALPADVKRYKPFLRSVRQVRATMDES
ncbi:MAG: AAA family ATPase [Gammaproteobacteria bacterium]|nr:AAA family ATPase [Gammaproteobacteria bacterium]